MVLLLQLLKMFVLKANVVHSGFVDVDQTVESFVGFFWLLFYLGDLVELLSLEIRRMTDQVHWEEGGDGLAVIKYFWSCVLLRHLVLFLFH